MEGVGPPDEGDMPPGSPPEVIEAVENTAAPQERGEEDAPLEEPPLVRTTPAKRSSERSSAPRAPKKKPPPPSDQVKCEEHAYLVLCGYCSEYFTRCNLPKGRCRNRVFVSNCKAHLHNCYLSKNAFIMHCDLKTKLA